MIFKKKLYEAGIVFVDDLFKMNGTAYTCDEFCNKYRVNVSYLEYIAPMVHHGKWYATTTKSHSRSDRHVFGHSQVKNNLRQPTLLTGKAEHYPP